MSDFEFISHREECEMILKMALLRGLEECGLAAEGFAKLHIVENKAIDTDALLNVERYTSFGASSNNDYICYRGSDYNPFDGMRIGDSRKAGQFFSTSVIKDRAFHGKYFFSICAPKGTNAAYVEKLSKKFELQREMLFDKDVEYELLYKKGNNIFLRVK